VSCADRIDSLTRKGIDASHYLVDLYLKLALPFASALLALVAVPIGGRLATPPQRCGDHRLGPAVGFGTGSSRAGNVARSERRDSPLPGRMGGQRHLRAARRVLFLWSE